MKYDRIRIGDVLPLEGFRKPFGGDCAPAWYIVTTGRQRREMVAASAWLVANGAEECWFPEDIERRSIRRGHRVFREKVEIPVVPGVLFMLTERAPAWDVIADRKRLSPMRIGERPVTVTEDVLAGMQKVPERIASLREAALEAERLAWEAKKPNEGEAAVFTEGPLKGMTAMVTQIVGSEVVVMIDGLRVKAQITSMERRS